MAFIDPMASKCAKKIYNNRTETRCTRTAVNTEDGKRWCSQHTPSLVEKRRADRYASYERERKERIALARERRLVEIIAIARAWDEWNAIPRVQDAVYRAFAENRVDKEDRP